jgi:hypothetical protein
VRHCSFPNTLDPSHGNSLLVTLALFRVGHAAARAFQLRRHGVTESCYQVLAMSNIESFNAVSGTRHQEDRRGTLSLSPDARAASRFAAAARPN